MNETVKKPSRSISWRNGLHLGRLAAETLDVPLLLANYRPEKIVKLLRRKRLRRNFVEQVCPELGIDIKHPYFEILRDAYVNGFQAEMTRRLRPREMP